MATRQFADLSSYRRSADARRNNPITALDSLISGAQQGLQLSRLPQQLQDQELARQLQNALMTQKLQDLQDPQAALARELQKLAVKEAVTNPNSGIIQSPIPGEVIATPQPINQTSQSLNALLQANPNAPIPSAAPTLPITPIGAGTVQTGLSIDQNVPLEAEARTLENKIALANARPYNRILTKEGYVFDPRNPGLTQAFLPTDPNLGLEDRRKTEADEAAKAKTDAAKAIADSKGALAKELQDDKQKFTGEQNDKNRENRLTLADKRSKLTAPGESTPYQQEKQTQILDSITELEKDVGYDTVGFADWLKAVPTSPARAFAGKLKTLKGNIAFGELSAMRADSKTGGALGAVSNLEIGLLESSLANLDQAQDPEEFKKELQKVRDSIQRWRSVRTELGAKNAPASNAAPATPSATGGNTGRFKLLNVR